MQAQLPLVADDEATTANKGAIRFTVIGRPQQCGSKRAFSHHGKLLITDANRKARPWMDTVREAAAEALPDGFELLRGPVEIHVTFRFARPKGHFRTGRNAGELKNVAPHWHASTPDCDKLCRALGDSLTGVVFADDRQVATWHAEKVYVAGSEGATVEIRSL
jgi:Holliday junction resolvase RusA-like endonuclease